MAVDILKKWWTRRGLQRRQARALYEKLVAQARRPLFYNDFGVPDTLDGRFELIALHVFVVSHRLKRAGDEARAVVQALLEVFVDDMDRSLREIGVGDLSVGRKVKQMVAGVYGRIAAYEQALVQGPTALADAVGRNVFGTVTAVPDQVQKVSGYLGRQVEALAATETQDVVDGKFSFSEPDDTSVQ